MDPRIALYGFGSFPIVFCYLIEEARRDEANISFCAILTLPHYRCLMREVLPASDILDIYAELPRRPIGGDPELLAGYEGSLAEDLAALKWDRRKRPSWWRFAQAIDYYRLFKDFLQRQSATHLLTSTVETPDAKLAVAVAKELGLGVIVPTDLRNLGGTYFSDDCYETPPAYARATEATLRQASAFLVEFRRRPTLARNIPVADDAQDETVLDPHLPPFLLRAKGFVANALERPDLFDYEMIRVSVMRSFGPIRKAVRGLRRGQNQPVFDIVSAEKLPRRFIYYPLQYTPESSINVPAPYFVDQFRAIDALRFAMPSDVTLVVKEHPACLEMRPPSFMRRLKRLPGVKIANVRIPSLELVRRASATATITGTAAFEAFLLGRPALVLGRGLSAWALGGHKPLGDLRQTLVGVLDRPLSDEFVVEKLATLFDARHPFLYATAHMPGEPMLRRGNIRRFWAALNEHLVRERQLLDSARRLAPVNV